MTKQYLKKQDIAYMQVLNEYQVLIVYKCGIRKVITGKINNKKLKNEQKQLWN
jgi:hypothetical protein